MPYNVPSLDEIIASLTKRVSNLESATYVYGNVDNGNNDPLVIQDFVGAVTYENASVTGAPSASVTWSWQGITTDPEDLTADPVRDYMLSVTPEGSASVAPYNSVGTETSATTTGVPLDSTVTGRVYAVTGKGLVGPVAVTNVVVGHDTTPPPQPSTPVVSAALRGVEAFWDGMTVTLTQMPVDFAYVEVHGSTEGPTFTPDATTVADRLFSGGGVAFVLAEDGSYDPIYVRLVAYDTSGNASVPSTAISATPKKLVSTDLDVALPGDIAYRDVGNLVLDGSFESASMRAQRLANFYTTGVTYGNAAGIAAHGVWYLRFTGSVTTPKYLYLNGGQDIDETPVTGGTYLYARAKVKGVGSDGTLNVVLRWTDNTGAYSYTTVLTTATATGSYVLLEGSALVPVNAATVAIRIETVSQTAGDWYVDAVELRNVIGTQLIQDAAITRAKIANLAVSDAQIETLSAGKITAGIMAANITVSGRIATALTGARVELNSTGLVAYDSGGNLTVAVATNGSALITGTYRTSFSGHRIEMSQSANIGGYDSLSFFGSSGTRAGLYFADSYSGLYLESPPSTIPATAGYVTQVSVSSGSASIAVLTASAQAGGATRTAALDFVTNGSISMFGPSISISSQSDNLQLGSTDINGIVTIITGNKLNTDRIEATSTGYLRLEPSINVVSQQTYNQSTTGSANMFVGSNGVFARSTSSERYKVNIDKTWSEQVDLAQVKKLTPASYYDKGDSERLAALLDAPFGPQPLGIDWFDAPRRFVGLIAEDVDALGLSDLVTYDNDGRPDAVHYDRVAVALLPWLHELEDRLEALEGSEKSG